MDATPSTLSSVRPHPWTGRVLAILLALALALFAAGLLVGRMTAPSTAHAAGRGGAPAASIVRTTAIPKVTGTGPDLIQVAEWSKAVRSAPVTGTGPGLSQVGRFGQSRG
jgi:hypothetical protein